MASSKSTNKPADNPKGNGPKLKTREEHAAAKKAAKARQARNRNKNAAKQGTYYEETHGRDRFLNRSEELAVLDDFRHQQHIKQARIATQFDELKELRPGSTARVMADAMVQAFPNAQPSTRGLTKVSKTQAAKEAALDELMKLEENHIGREGAIRKGAAVARAALNWAWSEVRWNATH